MTAFSSIYTSLTGMLSYSDALDVLSNNIANLNTPGFKGDDVLFRDLPPNNPDLEGGSGNMPLVPIGNGSEFFGTKLDFSEGPFQSTGNATDLSINGAGFFVLNDNGQQVFSQAGQFTFDSNGYLIDSTTKSRVQGYVNGSTSLSDIQIPPNSVNAATPTTIVNFSGVLGVASSSSTTTPTNPSATISNVIDSSGKAHTLTVTFTQDTSTATGTGTTSSSQTVWDISVTEDNGQTVSVFPPSITYGADNNPESGSDSVQVDLNGQEITLAFGTESGGSGTTSASGTSTISGTANGSVAGTLTGITFNQNGVAQLAYSNGNTVQGPQIAVATFADPNQLINIGTSLFQANPAEPGGTPAFGLPGSGGYGQIQPGQLELSNVNLSDEFSLIVVLQNGYQGSSQILQVSNQLLSDLYSSTGGQGGGSNSASSGD